MKKETHTLQFGHRFKTIRKSFELSQEAMGKRIGIKSTGFFSEVENGKQIPGGEILLTLKREFPTVNLNWLFTGKGEMLLAASEVEAEKSTEELIASLKEADIRIQEVISTMEQRQKGK